ncbi:MAG: hypothetical protein II851_06340 [Bacteroidales bacterium]|nr:hypothetical protein [Bacteroidales bacterium]
MRKSIISLLVLLPFLFVTNSCDITALRVGQEVAPSEESFRSNGIDTDYEFTYGLREFMQYSPKNPSGTNLIPYYDFFGGFALKLYVVGGKISFLEITNGEIPCDQYGFTLPSGKVACVYDEVAVPHALKLSTGETIAVFQSGEFVFPFILDCEELSYKMTFSTIETNREK